MKTSIKQYTYIISTERLLMSYQQIELYYYNVHKSVVFLEGCPLADLGGGQGVPDRTWKMKIH